MTKQTLKMSGKPSPATGDEAVTVRRQISLFQAVNICVGFMIGSGIFVSPYGVLMHVRSVGLALVLWTITGLFNLVGALCYAELGTTFPRSGGDYVYIRAGLGRFPAFLCMWLCITVLMPVGVAACALIFAAYVLKPIYPDCEPPDEANGLVAMALILLLTVINCFNMGWAAKLQILSTASAAIALVAIVILGLKELILGKASDTFLEPFSNSNFSPGALAMAFYSGFWAYNGWNCLNSIVEELKNPGRDLPRAVVASVSSVMVIYLLANVAYMAVLSTPDMMSSTAVALTFAERTLGRIGLVMPLFVAIAILGTINGAIMSTSRIVLMGAHDGNLPLFFSMIHLKYRTPIPVLLAMCGLALVLSRSSDIFTLIELVGFAQLLVLIMTYVSLIRLRQSLPDIKRPVKVHMALVSLMLVTCVCLLALTLYMKPTNILIFAAIASAAVPLYVCGVRWKNKPQVFLEKTNMITKFLQKLLLVVPQDTPKEDEIFTRIIRNKRQN